MSKMIKVPVGWEIKPLKDILTIQYGKDQKEVESENGKYPILGSGGVIGYTNNFLYDKPSVLIGRKGTINNPQYMETPFWTVDTLFYSHIKNKNIPKWVYYVFQSINWNSYNEASGVPSLSTANINRIEILKPTLIEQEKIAKILSNLDKGIDSTNRLIEKEKHIKTALMQELLTNGIDQNGQIRTKTTHIYKPSELGLIPEEWEIVKIIDFAEVKGGKRLPSDTDFTTESTNYPYIRVTDFLERTIDLKDIKFISKAVQLKIKNYIIDKDDVYISIAGTVGISGVIPEVLHKANLTENAAKICKIKNIDKDFLSFQINSESVQNEIQSYIGAAVQPKLALFRIEKLQIKKPLIEEQKQITKILITQDKKIQIEETNLAKLKELKKGLMNDLLSGKVRVKV